MLWIWLSGYLVGHLLRIRRGLIKFFLSKDLQFSGTGVTLFDGTSRPTLHFFKRINEGLLHFFKRIDVDLVPDRLHILVKIANFAGTKTQA